MTKDSDRFSERQEHRSIKELFLGQLPLEAETSMFILVNVLDFFMTYWLIVSGNFREANPVAKYFLDHWGPVKGMLYFKLSLVTIVCIITQIIALKDVGKAAWVLKFGALVVSCVVIYSLMLYLRQI